MTSEPFAIRPARPGDESVIHSLVCELAEFEKLIDSVVSKPADLAAALFADPPRLHALVAEVADQAVGMALFFPTFSSFAGKPGLWLEDLYVQPRHRGSGIGRGLLDALLTQAGALGCARAEWSVLDWNQDAIRFYESLGAKVLPDWRIARFQVAPPRRGG